MFNAKKCCVAFFFSLAGALIIAINVQLNFKRLDTGGMLNSQDGFVNLKSNVSENRLGFDTNAKTKLESETLSREKRGIFGVRFGLCLSFPLCCDVKGKDMCGFFCPVCPVKVDYCKYS